MADNESRFVAVATPLLRELTSEIDQLRKEGQALRDKLQSTLSSEGEYIRHKIQALYNAFLVRRVSYEKFARQVSQQIEHSNLDEIGKMELEVRLRQFEGAMQYASQVLAQCMQFK